MNRQNHPERELEMKGTGNFGRTKGGDENRVPLFRRLAPVFVLALFAATTLSFSQVPPRFYWKTLVGSNGVPLIYQSLSGNANPLDPTNMV